MNNRNTTCELFYVGRSQISLKVLVGCGVTPMQYSTVAKINSKNVPSKPVEITAFPPPQKKINNNNLPVLPSTTFTGLSWTLVREQL
jgi:hypothetical protein